MKRRQHSRPSDIKPNGVIASGARAHPKKKCSAVTKLLSFRACSNCCRKQTTWEEDVKQRNAIAGDKRAPDVSYSSSVQSSKVDICHISGKELDLNTRSKLQTSSLGVSGLGNDIRDSGLLSGRKNNKIRPFDFKSQSVQDDIHGNVYLGSPHHRLSIEFKSNNSGRFASNFNGSIVPEVLTSESTRCKPVKKMESTDSNNRHKQEPTYPPLFIRTEKVNNDQGFEKADPTNEQQTNGKIELFERQRNHSIVSNGRVSRPSKWSTISGKSDSSIARNARRRNEFLRQKSQEQIASKQRFFQNHSMQIEGHDSGDSPSDTQSLDEMPTLKRAISISPLPRDVTRDRPQGLIDTDLAVDHPSSDQESCASETASQYFTFQPENERIRIKY